MGFGLSHNKYINKLMGSFLPNKKAKIILHSKYDDKPWEYFIGWTKVGIFEWKLHMVHRTVRRSQYWMEIDNVSENVLILRGVNKSSADSQVCLVIDLDPTDEDLNLKWRHLRSRPLKSGLIGVAHYYMGWEGHMFPMREFDILTEEEWVKRRPIMKARCREGIIREPG